MYIELDLEPYHGRNILDKYKFKLIKGKAQT